MPTYSYKCNICEHEFDSIQKISNMDVPTHEPCPECAGEVVRCVTSCRVVGFVGSSQLKTPDGFKDRLKEIKKTAGKHCTIDV